MRIRRAPSNENGFTLIEVLMSAVIGLLVISSVGYVLDAGIYMAKDDRSQIYAMNALREEYDTLRRTGFDTIVGYGATSSFTNAQLTKLTGGAGTRTISSGLGADMRKVTLSVSWTSRNGRTLTERVSTYVSRSGVNGA